VGSKKKGRNECIYKCGLNILVSSTLIRKKKKAQGRSKVRKLKKKCCANATIGKKGKRRDNPTSVQSWRRKK